jgi:hypothetical protein
MLDKIFLYVSFVTLLFATEAQAAFPVAQRHPANTSFVDRLVSRHLKAEPKEGTDTFAILALISLFVFPPLAIIFGALGMDERLPRHRLALVCLILGAIYTAIAITVIIQVFNAR